MLQTVKFYIVDVFANDKYEGNQLAVFIDLENAISDDLMQKMAKEINFAETTFVKANKNDERFVVRIFTPEHEIPFAGHPSLGTSYVIAKFLVSQKIEKLTLELKHADIAISIEKNDSLDNSIFFMKQAQPEFRAFFDHKEMVELGIDLEDLQTTMPIQEITTGLPYIIIPLKNLQAMENLKLSYHSFQKFLYKRQKYRTNSSTGHSTSLFFFTEESYLPENQYNTRMLLLENGHLSEDAATGSANGCFLAYLLKHSQKDVKATVEQGFQMNRKSYIYLDGKTENDLYEINVGGRVKMVSDGVWYL